MIKADKLLKHNNFILVGIFIIAALYKLVSGVSLGMDAPFYLDKDARVGGFYLFILHFFYEQTGLIILIFLQLTLLTFSSIYFLLFIQKKYELSKSGIFLIATLLLFPVFRYGNMIMTEAFSFSFFLLTLVFFLKSLHVNKVKNLSLFCLFGTFLIFSRIQFLFLSPALFLFYLFNIKKYNISLLRIFLTHILSIMFALQCIALVHLGMHGKYCLTPFGSIASFANALYIDKGISDLHLENQKTAEHYNNISKTIVQKRLNQISYFGDSGTNASNEAIMLHYQQSYNLILHEIYREKNGIDSNHKNINAWLEIQSTANTVHLQLIQQQFSEYFQFYFIRLIKTGFRSYVLSVFFILVLILSFLNRKNSIYNMLFFISLLHLSNLLLSNFGALIEQRYTFYTEILWYIFLTMAIFKGLNPMDTDKIEIKKNIPLN